MTTLVRWDPFREMTAMHNELSRLIGFRGGNGGGAEREWAPALDVWETNDEIVYAFDLPGIPEEEISVEFEDGVLTVTAERTRASELKEDSFYRSERRFGSFSRTIGLPQGVEGKDISAAYENGVLEVHVRRPEDVKPRRIPIGVESTPPVVEGKATKT